MKITFSLAFILLFAYAKAQHTLVLTNGDKINGVVLSLQNDEWLVFVGGAEKTIHMKEVSSVFFKEYIPYDGKHQVDGQEREIIVDGFTVRYKIKDRDFETEPKVSIGTEDHGTVVVKIEVDRYGNIKVIESGVSGSTTSSRYLLAKATAVAKSAKFNKNLKGPIRTEGTITVVY